MKKFLLSLSVLLLFAVSVFCGEWDGYFVVLHTNDIHGRAYSSENYWGYAGIKRAKDYFEKQGADVFLADAGDFSQGTPLVNLGKGKNAVDFMNRAGYNAAALGNHEFDWGIDSLLNNLEKSRFKVLCCNILRASDNEPIFETNMVFETKSGKKVGVFGVDTPECAVKVHPGKITGLRFLGEKDMYNEAQKQIAELKNKNCSFIICLGHLGDSDESYLNRSIDLIDNTRGINLFVDGHSHTKLEKGVWQNNTFRVSAGEFSKNIGCVIYKETEQGFEFKEYLFSSPEKGFSELFSHLYDEKLKKYIDNINAEITEKLSQPVAVSEVELNGDRAPGNRTEETNLGDLTADAVLWKAKEYTEDCDCALVNGGSLRSGFGKGNISVMDLKTCNPYDNEICIIKVKGSELLEALEAATCVTPTELGAFPQVAGIEMTVDTGTEFVKGEKYPDSVFYAPKNPGSRVTVKSVGGKSFDPEKIYTLATSDFMAMGGDTYYVFRYAYRTSGIDTGMALDEAVGEYMEKYLKGKIGADYASPKGRILIK